MMCHSMKSGQKFQRARNGITRNLSREENGSESSAESVSESKRKGVETRVKAEDKRRRGRGGWSVKSKQSNAQREIELGERVSLFFINRPIKQVRPPSMFYFVRFLPYLFLSSCCLLSSLLFCSFFSRCRESLCSCLRPSLDSSRSVSHHESPPPPPSPSLPLRGGAPFVGWVQSSSFFAILFNFFARGRNPFITWTRDSSV